MKHYVSKFYTNYADEFNVDGISIMNEEEYNELQDLKEKVKAHTDFADNIMYICIGSNEDLEDTPIDFLNAIRFTEITEEEYNVLKRYVSDFGMKTPFDIMECVKDRLDEYISDEEIDFDEC